MISGQPSDVFERGLVCLFVFPTSGELDRMMVVYICIYSK